MSTEIVFNQREDVSAIVLGLGRTATIIWAEAVKQLLPEMGESQTISMALAKATDVVNVPMSKEHIFLAEEALLKARFFESQDEDRMHFTIPKNIAYATYGRSDKALDNQKEHFFGFDFFAAE